MDLDSSREKIFRKYHYLISDENIENIKDIAFADLGYVTKNLEKFFSSMPSAPTRNQNSAITKLADLIVSFGLVKSFKESEDRDYDSRDFPYVAKEAEECFRYLFLLLEYYEKLDTSNKRKFLVPVLLLCATHNSDYFWSSEETIALSKNFVNNLLEHSKHKTLNSLLCDDTFHPTIFKAVLKYMRPTLMKDTWMKNPSSCYVFYWFLSHVKHPYLVDYLSDVLPPSFMFSSYYALPQQTLGIKCFDHILDNVPPSLLKANGIEDAVFDALKKYIYFKERPLVEVLYPCLLKLPKMNLHKVNHIRWFEFDNVLQQLLLNVDMESDAKLRHLFLNQTYLFIKSTPCFKHLKKCLHILLRNFVANSVDEEKCRIVALEIIKELIRSCWPRMEYHCFDIIYAILKAICDIEIPSYTPDNALSEEVLNGCQDCLKLLKEACPDTFENLVKEYTIEDDSMPGAKLLKDILQDSQV